MQHKIDHLNLFLSVLFNDITCSHDVVQASETSIFRNFFRFSNRNSIPRTPLVVWWLKTHLSMEGPGLIPGQEGIPHALGQLSPVLKKPLQ